MDSVRWVFLRMVLVHILCRYGGMARGMDFKLELEKNSLIDGRKKPLVFSKQLYANYERDENIQLISPSSSGASRADVPIQNDDNKHGGLIKRSKPGPLINSKRVLRKEKHENRQDNSAFNNIQHVERQQNIKKDGGIYDEIPRMSVADKNWRALPAMLNGGRSLNEENIKTKEIISLKKNYLFEKEKGENSPKEINNEHKQRLIQRVGNGNEQYVAEKIGSDKQFLRDKTSSLLMNQANILEKTENKPNFEMNKDLSLGYIKDETNKLGDVNNKKDDAFVMKNQNQNQNQNIHDGAKYLPQRNSTEGLQKAISNFMRFLWGDKKSSEDSRLGTGSRTSIDQNESNVDISKLPEQKEKIPDNRRRENSEENSSDFEDTENSSSYSTSVIGHVVENSSSDEELQIVSSTDLESGESREEVEVISGEDQTSSSEHEIQRGITSSGMSGIGSGETSSGEEKKIELKVKTWKKIKSPKPKIKATKMKAATSKGENLGKNTSKDAKKKLKKKTGKDKKKENQNEKEAKSKSKSSKRKKFQKSKDFPPVEPPDFSYLEDQSEGNYELLFLKDKARSTGAYCLDGSPPSLFIRHGLGDGVRKWIIYLQGGAWCYSLSLCYGRTKTSLGTSTMLSINSLSRTQQGINSPRADINPNFYFWNVAIIPYCDGASFSGNISEPVEYKDKYLYFRGIRVLHAAIDELLDRGLIFADEVIFAGSSAGGLAVMLHADDVRSRLPDVVYFRALMDAGFFVDAKSLYGDYVFRNQMQKVVKIHNIKDGVDRECKEANPEEIWRCLFPQYAFKFLDTPTFVFNPLFDSWQLRNIYGIDCVTALSTCSRSEKESVINYRQLQYDALSNIAESSTHSHALFADSCIEHVQCFFDNKWFGVMIGSTRLQQYFYDWYYGMLQENTSNVLIDTELPLNPTCRSFYKLYLSDPNVLNTEN